MAMRVFLPVYPYPYRGETGKGYTALRPSRSSPPHGRWADEPRRPMGGDAPRVPRNARVKAGGGAGVPPDSPPSPDGAGDGGSHRRPVLDR